MIDTESILVPGLRCLIQDATKLNSQRLYLNDQPYPFHMQKITSLRNRVLILSFIMSLPTLMWSQFISKNELEELVVQATMITQGDDFSKADWTGISGNITEKRLVLLGEFTHGANEIFEMQNSLIRYLHENHDFDVILFESGIGELIDLNEKKNELTPAELTYGFFGGWRNQSRRNLMDFIKEMDLSFAGFDSQRFGRSFQETLRKEAIRHTEDSLLYSDLEKQFTSVSSRLRSLPYDSIRVETEKLISDYERILEILEDNGGDIIISRTILNRIEYLRYYLEFTQNGDWSARFGARESIMAENIIWLAENIFPNQKLIIMAHNYHISRKNEKESTMGEYLNDHYGDQMYSIASFASEGSYADNSGKPKSMEPPDTTQLDIKHIIEKLDGFCQYVPVKSNNVSLFNRNLTLNDTFIDLWGTNEMVLSKHFDALVFLRKVSPPQK